MSETDNKAPAEPSKKKKKKNKKKGPIRWEAIIPIAVIVVLCGLYFSYFFDRHMRKAIEWTAGYVHGAEVNLAVFSTSFLDAKMEMRGLQVTDKEQPERNLVAIGSIRFNLIWDALLRAKFVVEEASINEIQALSPRKRKGWVKPPPPPGSAPSPAEEIESKLKEKAMAEINDNILGDVVGLVQGVKVEDQLKKMQGELKTDSRIKELQAELKKKEAAWKERIAKLPKPKEFDEYNRQLKAIKFDIKKPIEFAENLKKANKIVKEADSKVQLVKRSSKDLKADVNVYSVAVKDLEKMVKQDIKDLQKRMKIPEVNGAEFTKRFFMDMMKDKLASVLKYAALAKEYIPPPNSKAERKSDRFVPQKRGDGKNYKFRITKGYPVFWLKNAKISSVANQSEWSGNLEGAIKDATSNPTAVGRPTLLTLKGDFPNQKIMGIDSKIVIDHRTVDHTESFEVSVASYPVDKMALSEDSNLKFSLDSAFGGLKMSGKMQKGVFDVQALNVFTQPQYTIQAKEGMVEQILKNIMKDIPKIDVLSRARGNLKDFSLNLRSNLGDELAKGFKKQVDAKIKEAKAKMKAMVDSRVKAERDKLEAQFEKFKGQALGGVNKRQAELEKKKKDLEDQVKGAKGSGGAKSQLEQKGKKAVDDLKKKFGF